jgi:DNA polymerase III delta prime subunit
MKIDLTKNNKNYPVNMIMMPNGVGKTTTLILLRAILSGNAKNWNKEKILSFKPENHDVSNGYFKLDLNLDNEHYSIKLIFDYDNGVANYQTSRVSAGGISDGYNIKEDARRVLTEGFIKRFIFNGELAEEIL